MRSPIRLRASVKWCGSVLSLLLLTVWIGSNWWGVSRIDVHATRGATAWYIGAGQVRFTRLGVTWIRQVPLNLTRTTAPFDVGWDLADLFSPPVTEVHVPLWWPLVAAVGATAQAWRPDIRTWRRARRGECLVCGYDLAGAAGGAACPECGGSSVVDNRA